jgi:hypothetical protein
LEINASYLAYLYVVLLGISITYLQRPDLYRRIESTAGSLPWPRHYAAATGIIATGLNWLTWLLSAFVAQQFGIAQGVLFFVAAMGSSMVSNLLLPRWQVVDWYGHILSIPVTVIFVRAVLQAVGIQTGI